MHRPEEFQGVQEWVPSEIPATQPQGSRGRPPVVPPAPPGHATPGGWGGDSDWPNVGVVDSVGKALSAVPYALRSIQDLLRGIDGLRDDPRQQALRREFLASRQAVIQRSLRELSEVLEENPGRVYRTHLGWWKVELFRMMKRGTPRHELDAYFQTQLFSEVGGTEPLQEPPDFDRVYRYRLYGSAFPTSLMPARLALQRFLQELLLDTANPHLFESRRIFDRTLHQKALALIFAAELATQPPEETPLPPGLEALSQDDVNLRSESACRTLLGEWRPPTAED